MIFRKIKGITCVCLICALFTSSALLIKEHHISKTSTHAISYILDAGHGIPDGGTVGIDLTTTEAQLNLEITLQISNLLKKKKITHQMTRTDENSIYSEGETIHAKKVSDVRNRIAIANQTPDIPLISIHMNSFPDRSVHGIQVFFGNGENAKKIATDLQNTINKKLQPNHPKVVKEVPKSIYLFSHIDNPVILIECGFISNQNELDQLKDKAYQKKLTETIAKVLTTHS